MTIVKTDPAYYPVCLSTKGKRCLIVGGGEVAARKAGALAEAGAEVVVVSPDLCDTISERADITVLQKPWDERDLDGAFLVIAATNDRALNEKVARVAEEKRVLCNVVDDATLSDFIVPASVRRGALLVSISTSGALPALARKTREDLEKQFGQEYADYLDIVGQMRENIIRDVPDETARREIFRRLAEPQLIAMLHDKGEEAVRGEIERIVREAAPER
jgi:precorrin-2 dehydrogenase/sirohydrochlorin ferrochelatase